MEFKKLADVNLLESAPENATAFAEVNGEVVRVKGGVGGSSYTYDFTDKIIELMTSEEPRYEIQENLMAWSPTWEEVQEIIEKAMEVDNFKLKADVAKIFKATGEDEESANTDFFVSYEGPMNMKMYNKENRQAAIFIGYMGFDAVTHNFIHLPLFLLSYGQEDATPMIALAMPTV